ncbi:KAT8 regulatory NSL complex subunit 3 [Bienertia sinuspersici]
MTNIKNLSLIVAFAHGVGAPSNFGWMIRWKEMQGKALNAVKVVTFEYPYLAGGKKGSPPKAEKLVDFHVDIVVSCMVASRDDISASAIVCLGYPLKGMNGAIRDEILVQLTIPIMFVQGSKDGLCPQDNLKAVQKRIKPNNDLHVIEGGDYSFKIVKKHLQASETTQMDAEEFAVQSIASFVSHSLLQS